jgi:hypothetical protein
MRKGLAIDFVDGESCMDVIAWGHYDARCKSDNRSNRSLEGAWQRMGISRAQKNGVQTSLRKSSFVLSTVRYH